MRDPLNDKLPIKSELWWGEPFASQKNFRRRFGYPNTFASADRSDFLLFPEGRWANTVLARSGVQRLSAHVTLQDGFGEDLSHEIRQRAIWRSYRVQAAGTPSMFWHLSPFNGWYHIGIEAYDMAGDPLGFCIRYGPLEIGPDLPRHHDNRVNLWVTCRPIELCDGGEIRVYSLPGHGVHRVENIYFIPTGGKRLCEPGLEICRPYSVQVEGRKLMVDFRTPLPASARVTLTPGNGMSRAVSTGPRVKIHHAEFQVPAATAVGRVTVKIRAFPGHGTIRPVKFSWSPPRRICRTWKHLRVPLHVDDAGLQKLSVPMVRGCLDPASGVSVMAADGTMTLCQSRILATWPDGSAQWVQVVFRAAGRGMHYLTAGGEPIAGPVLSAPADAWRKLDARFNLYEESGWRRTLSVDLADARPIWQGPVYSCYRWQGSFTGQPRDPGIDMFIEQFSATGLGLKIRFEAGQGTSEDRHLAFRRLSLVCLVGRAGRAHEVAQMLPFEYRVRQGSGQRTVRRGKAKVAGVFGDQKRGVGLEAPLFAELYPKAVLCQPSSGTLEFALLPGLEPGLYDASTPENDRLHYHLRDGVHRLSPGTRVETPLLLSLCPEEGERKCLSRDYHRLSPRVDPHWVRDSGVFGQIQPFIGVTRSAYDRATLGLLRQIRSNQKRMKLYGYHNFGDWWGERGLNWGNLEYDTPFSYYQEYLRGGSGEYLRLARESAAHMATIDMVHRQWCKAHEGRLCAHAMGHTGGYFPPEGSVYGSPETHFHMSHCWSAGILLDYFMSGDPARRETAEQIADTQIRLDLQAFNFANIRGPGWFMIMTAAMYQGTGRHFYLQAGNELLKTMRRRVDPQTGGFDRMLVPEHCMCANLRHRGEALFMVGVALRGLMLWHEITGNPDILPLMRSASLAIIRQGCDLKRGRSRYTSCPASPDGTGLTTLMMPGLLYLLQWYDDPELRQAARIGMKSFNAEAVEGIKSVSVVLRDGPVISGMGLPAQRTRKRA